MPSSASLHYPPEPLDCGRQHTIWVCFVKEKKTIPITMSEQGSRNSRGGSQKEQILKSHCQALEICSQELHVVDAFFRCPR